ncbi:MAG TPA: ATP-binding protein [Tepidisphaeraceae bacterium]|nr:ATP-binding protein [Tepidisphaeraceae bacterium]
MSATLTTSQPAQAASASAVSAAVRIEELGRIIEAYSQVTEKLQKSHAQLQQTVQSLRNDLAEKNRQLERRKRLEALGQMAAGMAHEIRNPLGGIQLYASMLAQDLDEMPASLALVRKISVGVKRLEELVSQVLRFAREMKINPAEVDLAGVVDQAVELAQAKFNERSIQCETEGPRPMPARVDPLLLGQAVLNLLFNAAEACPVGGQVRVQWKNIAGQTRLSVSDNGPGVPVELMDRIFNPFFTTRETGTGLGLAIVHRIVEAHDGTISVSSSPEGGALFEIRL